MKNFPLSVHAIHEIQSAQKAYEENPTTASHTVLIDIRTKDVRVASLHIEDDFEAPQYPKMLKNNVIVHSEEEEAAHLATLEAE